MQRIFGPETDRLAKETKAVRRVREFRGATLAQTFVMGFLQKPNASMENLAQMAGVCGVHVTPQAIEQRFTPALAKFLERLFWTAVRQLVQTNEALVPLLQRFTGVFLLDSTTISLPPALAKLFPGCGGVKGVGEAAIKFQVIWDLLRGGLHHVIAESGRDCDVKSSAQSVRLPRGALRIADLGYFCLRTLVRLMQEGIHWISRIQSHTAIFRPDGQTLDLLAWLARNWQGVPVDMKILLGVDEKIPCRLLAWKVPQEIANRRRQKVLAESRRKGRTPSHARLAWCDWMVLVTDLGPDKLTWHEAVALYRARWQIELLFKLWKSHGLIAELTGSTLEQQMVRFWSRLLAVLLQHWLLLISAWGEMAHSFTKVAYTIRTFAHVVASVLRSRSNLRAILADLRNLLACVARQNKRRKPGTWQLLQNPELIDYALT
jgi:hypothetical protein